MRWWDIAAVLPLEDELFGAEAWSARSYWSELAQRDSRHYLLVEDADGGVAAYGGLGFFGDESWILTLGVRRTAQGKGLGTLVLQALLAESDARGVSRCLLEVRVDNPVAQRLYQRHGFTRIGIRKGYYQPSNTDAAVMQRSAPR